MSRGRHRLVILILLGFLVLALFKFLPSFLSGNFRKFERYTVALDGAKTFLVSVSTKGEGAVIVPLPNDLYLTEVAHGYGQYRVSKIYQVGQLDHRGGVVLRDSLSEFFGVPVEGFVHSETKISNARAHLTSLDFVFRDKSNLSVFERIELLRVLYTMRFDKIKQIDLAPKGGKVVLADGSSAISIQIDELDRLLVGEFVDQEVEKESARVAVVNSTKVAGLGNRAARILSNIGISVVSVDSSPVLIRQCLIRSKKKMMESITVKRIAAIFTCKVEEDQEGEKWDATVLVGQQYAEKMLR